MQRTSFQQLMGYRYAELELGVFQPGDLTALVAQVAACRAIRRAFPSSRVTLLARPWAWELSGCFKELFDGFVAFPGFPGPEEKGAAPARAVMRFLSECQGRNLDAVFDLSERAEASSSLCFMTGARFVCGFFSKGLPCPDERLFLALDESERTLRRSLRLLEALRIPLDGEHLELPLPADAFDAATETLHRKGVRPGQYIWLEAEASPFWSTERMLELTERFKARKLKTVLSASADVSVRQELAQEARGWAADLSDETGLGLVAALIARARAVVGGDIGIAHLAAAFGVPTVTIAPRQAIAAVESLGPLHRGVSSEEPNLQADDVARELDRAIGAVAEETRRASVKHHNPGEGLGSFASGLLGRPAKRAT